jgi:hypothetical protein
MKHLYALLATTLLCAPAPLWAEDLFDPDYPGSEVIAGPDGQVHVKAVLFANDTCWQIVDAYEGVQDRATYEPTDRHLYVTVNVRHEGTDCALTNQPLETRLVVPDAKGTISMDIFFVDDRGVLFRSQRHRIQRDSCLC